MTITDIQEIDDLEHEDFDFVSIDEELLVDGRCQTLLKHFYLFLQTHGHTVQRASDLAYSADLYLRDYVLDFARQNVVRPQTGIVRKFAGNWFITHTLDPDMVMLEQHLEAIRQFYRFLQSQHFISREELQSLEGEAAQSDFYRQRIDSFLAIHGDGYDAWEAECSLKD